MIGANDALKKLRTERKLSTMARDPRELAGEKLSDADVLRPLGIVREILNGDQKQWDELKR